MRSKIIKQKKSGFTLVELMFAVFILLVSILASLSGLIGSLFLNNSSSNLTSAVNDAQYVLEQIKGLNYTTCIQNNFAAGCYTLPVFTNLPGEAVALSPAPTIGPSISKITVTISWLDKQKTRSFSLATYIAK
jgi:prepilin-type N-terminal cleavage/methylation domain-containing protein